MTFICTYKTKWTDTHFVPKSKLLIEIYYQTHDIWTLVQKEGLSVYFKFWVQAKNESIFP